MKKIFLLTFITFCSLIFYQIVLGKNGVIEGHITNKEKEKAISYILFLKKEINKNNNYIEYLKKDPDALKSFAEDLGYFQDDNTKLIKIIEEVEKDKPNNTEYSKRLDKPIEEIIRDENFEKKITRIRFWLTIFFYAFFGFFIFLILFGVKKSEE